MPAAAPARWRSRRRGAAPRSRRVDISPTLIGLAKERAEGRQGSGEVRFLVGDMLDRRIGQLRPRRRDGQPDPLPRGGHGCRCRATRRASRRIGAVHLRAAHGAADGDAHGRAPAAARRPRPGDRTRAARPAGGNAGRWRPPARRPRAPCRQRLLHLPGDGDTARHEPRRRHDRRRPGPGSARASCPSPMRRRRSFRWGACCGCRCSRYRSASPPRC